MTKTVELRRHTDNDGDRLSDEGIAAAVDIGSRLAERYEALVSSGAQRSTQALACMVAALGRPLTCGVTVDEGFRSEVEDRWKAAAKGGADGTIPSFAEVDGELVESEAPRLAAALRRVLDALPEDGRALVVGHSPLHEAAVYGLTGETVEPLGKGEGVVVTADGDDYRVERAP